MMNDGRFSGGPTTEEIIEARQKHRAEDIWNGQDNVERRIFYHGNLRLEWDLSDRQKELVAMAGFGYYNSIIWVHHDVKLIYAIAERFWPKTCTFHFHFGELGITLEDVLYCVGLPITGGAVTGVQHKNYTFFIQSLLGRDPPDSAAVRGTVKYSWLKDQFSHLPLNPTEEQILQSTRAYLLCLLGREIFSNTTGNEVSLIFLPLLEDLTKCTEYAWGAAALGYLYRQLRLFVNKTKNSLCGCTMLMQVWAHERLPRVGRPTYRPGLYHYPRAIKWMVGNRAYKDDPRRSSLLYRQELDLIKDNEVEWQPYADTDNDIIAAVPMLTTSANDSFLRCPLVCFEVIEYHPADRCLRQWGHPQNIPPEPMQFSVTGRQGQAGRNWSDIHRRQINLWESRYMDGQIIVHEAYQLAEVYQAWYGKPQVHNRYLTFTEDRYIPRGYTQDLQNYSTAKCDNLEQKIAMAVNTLLEGLNVVQFDPSREYMQRACAILQCPLNIGPPPIIPTPPEQAIFASHRRMPKIQNPRRRQWPRQPQQDTDDDETRDDGDEAGGDDDETGPSHDVETGAGPSGTAYFDQTQLGLEIGPSGSTYYGGSEIGFQPGPSDTTYIDEGHTQEQVDMSTQIHEHVDPSIQASEPCITQGPSEFQRRQSSRRSKPSGKWGSPFTSIFSKGRKK